ncbi:MAG: asparagine synthase-related protein [Coleofasciculaceae cyanobacterium]
MANFIIVVDPDPERRSHFTKTIEPLLPPIKGLVTNSCTTGAFQASWATYPGAPISSVASSVGAAVVWGEAIKPGESTRIDAKTLQQIWQESPHSGLPAYDGYYAAVAYHPHFGLTVAVDILGIFPLYYYTQGEVALVASSPELFRYHPLFSARFNPVGLVGILLTNGMVNGQTLWQGVKRLDVGHSLLWQPEKLAQELPQPQNCSIVKDNIYYSLSFSEQLEVLEQALEQSMIRHAQEARTHTILLSGGLDSRLIAGFLQRQGVDTVALTLGKRTDLEMSCAIPVAHTLGLPHHKVNIPLQEYPNYANLLVKWEQLANGGNCIMGWGIPSNLSELPSHVVAGFLLDRVIGGKSTYSLNLESLSFQTFFDQCLNPWGLRPQILDKLLKPDTFADLVSDIVTQTSQVYHNYSEEEIKRTWWFELRHRQRFHVGSAAWQLSFGAWPVLPVLDQQLLATAAALPSQTLDKRLAQETLVCDRFPQLAELPLDRNNFNVEPLVPSGQRQKLARLFRLQQKWRRWQQRQGYERRYYYRTFDINNSGWQAVRHQAEPYREKVQHLFCREVLDELLPPPDQPITHLEDAIIEASGIKALLGFLLWSGEHL